MAKTKEQLLNILDQFQLDEKVVSAEPFGNGHINDTLKVTNEKGEIKYVLQRINHLIFTNVDMLQNNIHVVTTHIRKKLEEKGETDIDRKVLTFLPTKDGKKYYFDGDSYWRVCLFIPRSKSYEEVTPELSYEAGKAFGDFQTMLSDIPEGTLGETIPDFHNTPARFQVFKKAVEEDVMGRAKDVQEEINFVLTREQEASVLTDMLQKGELPLRVTHNDTKLNNILFDKTTGEGLCVIDLDTVMPGLAANDFGDSIRFGANHCAEDEADLSKVNFSMELFEIYTKGFLQAAGETFTPLEKQTLPWGAKLMTMECGMRFLADYLEGDHYFHINYETQNLNRARTQFTLVRQMEEVFGQMLEIVS